MTQNNSTDDPLADGAQLTPADGATAVDSGLTLTDLNKALGKDFKDLPTAIKAVQDTFGYVGKRREDIAAELRVQLAQQSTPAPVDNELKSKVQSLEDQLFYSNNPQYKGMESIIKKMGSNPAEVTASEEFKTLFEKVQTAEQFEKTRSVAPSNARLAAAQSTIQTAVQTANSRGSTIEDVAAVFARAINEGHGG